MPETFSISETVLVALITFLAGLFGSIIGAVSTYLTAKRSSDSELKKLLHNERLNAYSEFMDSYLAFSAYLATSSDTAIPQKEQELYIRFNVACSRASLLSSRTALTAINGLILAMNDYGQTRILPTNVNTLYRAAVDAMRNDLLLERKADQ